MTARRPKSRQVKRAEERDAEVTPFMAAMAPQLRAMQDVLQVTIATYDAFLLKSIRGAIPRGNELIVLSWSVSAQGTMVRAVLKEGVLEGQGPTRLDAIAAAINGGVKDA